MTVEITELDRVLVVTINRPDVVNALDYDTIAQLAAHYEQCSTRTDIDVVVLESAQPGFCSGGDLRYVAEHLEDLPSAVERFLDASDALVTTMATMRQVTVSAVDGVAAGAGLSLAAATDICVASERSRFRPAYLGLGVPPDLGGTVSVPRRIGPHRAMALFLTEQVLDAHRARDIGLVDQIFPDTGFEANVRAMALRIAEAGPAAVATKAMIRYEDPGVVVRGLAQERERLLAAMSSASYRDRIQRFLAGDSGRRS